MRGVDISLAVEQVVGAGECAGQRALVVDADGHDLIERAPGVAQVTEDRRTDVGRLRPSTTLIGGRRAQLRCPGHRRHGADRITTVQVVGSDAFDQRRDLLVRTECGLGEVPGTEVIAHNDVREHEMGVTALIARRQLDHSGADQWVPEAQPPRCFVNPDDAGLLGRSEVIEAGAGREPPPRSAGRPFRRGRRAATGRSSLGATPESSRRTVRAAGR